MTIKYAYVYLLVICFFIGVTNTFANVTVTSGGNLNLCVGATYTTIGKITIAEGAATDFSANATLQTYEINAPSNFEFNPGNGSVTATGADITFSALTVTSTKITLYYLLNATATTDKFELTNIQIRATNPSGSQNLMRTAGSAVQPGNDAYANVHASVTANQAYVNLNLGSLDEVCINEGSQTLAGGNPGGGTYSGTGVSGGSTFNPAIAGVGTYTITYTATQNGCIGTATATIKVNPKPSVTFFGLDATYCSNGPDDQLTGFPSGGTFSGSMAISGTLFKPYVPSVGNKNIMYSYTDGNGCSDSYTLSTTILQAPKVFITVSPDKSSYAINDVPVTISGTQSDPSSGGTITLSGNGVSNATSTFTPLAAGTGTHEIIRMLEAPNGCIAIAKRDMTVSNSTIIINGLLNKYCIYNSPSNLSTNLGSGTFSGPGITYADGATGTAIFDPAAVDFGDQQQVTITIELKYGLTVYPQTTTVYKRPVVKIIQDITGPNFRTVFCNQDASVPISVSTFPAGGSGSFSGSQAILGNTFNPAAATALGASNPNKVIYTYTDVNGCINKDSCTVIVNAVTTGLDFTGLDSKYCDKNAVVPLKATNGGTEFQLGVFSGVGINGRTFNPNIAAQYNNGAQSSDYVIVYTYVNEQNCKTIVEKNTKINLSPEVSLSGFNSSNEYCYGNDSIKLIGNPSSGASGSGVFSIKAISSTAVDPQTLSGNYFYPNKTTNPGTYRVFYKYSDNTTLCSNTDSATVVVHELPVVSFTSLDTLYCIYDNAALLDGSPAQTSGTLGIYSSVGNTAAITSNKFQPAASGVGTHIITYAYTDKNGCSSSVTKTTKVYGRPTTAAKNKTIKLSTACEGDLIKFSDYGASLDISNGAASVIKRADWKFDNIVYVNDFKVDTSFYLEAGAHVITYKLTTDKGCYTQFDSTIIVGSYPETGFTWDKICNKEDTKFINTTSIVQGKVTSVVWNFGDGNAPVTLQTVVPSDGNTVHKFENVSDDLPSTYTVILTANTDYNCKYADTQKVFILPSQTISSAVPYVNDFNLNNGGWIASSPGDSLLSWVLSSPNKKFIKSTNPAWVTNDIKAFKPEEISYVYSPCFTLDDITKPMIHMDIWSGTRKDIAGANLQYSVDGTNFITLGRPNESGVNWYNNSSNIVSRPSGTALYQDGWTGIDSIGWKNARHIFDNEIGANKNIRFRISFAATTDTTTDGFAFDNVWIGDRTRLILTEHFTNNSSFNTKYENDTLNKLIAANLLNNEPKDIIKLEYHTAFPGSDQMNLRNIPDAGARSLYYGVTQIPYTSVDGSYFNGNTLRVNQNMIDTRSLYDPAFEITLNPMLTSTAVSGSVTVKNKIPVTNNVTVYISMLERFVNGVPGSNGESSYQWVHAKFLPDAAGTSFAPNWTAQNSQTVNFNWNFGSGYLYDPNKLAIIAFVQDNVTKEIYQAAYKGLGSTVTTGIFYPNEETSTVTLYPNPANDLTTVILNGKLTGAYNWVILDELGRTVDEGSLTDGTDGFTINTQNYASGFYTLRIGNANDGVKTQKFVVLH